jgi:hypothetical protein
MVRSITPTPAPARETVVVVITTLVARSGLNLDARRVNSGLRKLQHKLGAGDIGRAPTRRGIHGFCHRGAHLRHASAVIRAREVDFDPFRETDDIRISITEFVFVKKIATAIGFRDRRRIIKNNRINRKRTIALNRLQLAQDALSGNAMTIIGSHLPDHLIPTVHPTVVVVVIRLAGADIAPVRDKNHVKSGVRTQETLSLSFGQIRGAQQF